MNSPKLSIVTGHCNRPDSLARLIRSIEACAAVDWELVISDASDVAFLSANPRVRIMPEKPRLGCTKGYNRAFRQARGEWVMWLNDDVEVLRGFDNCAIAFMEAHERIGLGALHYAEPPAKPEFHVNEAWGCLYANFGILRRELGESVGWMDPEIEMYGCDNSLTLKVLLKDKGVADIPEARVIHHSVKDAVRAANQKNKTKDNRTLTVKYMPLRRHWLANYKKHRIDSGNAAWAHGQKPAMATR